MRIPITMCHGISTGGERPLSEEHFDALMKIAADMGFQSITYEELAAWYDEGGELPDRPIMIDIDHPVISLRYGMLDILNRYGYRATLFVNTEPVNTLHSGPIPPREEREFMTWDELGALMENGWHIGAHTVTHPNLSQLSVDDPSGERLREELDKCNDTLQKQLGVSPKDFAYTGTSFSTAAESAVKERYRFGRLWIVGSVYQVDGAEMRYAELVGVEGPDEPDGGPPHAARYITEDSPRYRLPSMELQALIHQEQAFRKYLEGALEE